MTTRATLNDDTAGTTTTEVTAVKSASFRSTAEGQRDDIYNSLIDYFRNYTNFPLSPFEQRLIRDAFKLKKVRRRQFLVQEGDVCKYICFVKSGALRIYSVNERGQEAVVAFALEGKWMSDWESVVTQTPSRYYIDAVENSEILQITPAELHALEAKIPAIDEFLRLEQRLVAVTTQKRIHTAISMNAEERYQDLLENHPEYFQRFSQNMIASYLGIKPETLSRLRRR
ncbi:Crp/Fnr family transcriptional regulator [Desertivirga brevis]|uniref:Crp/Fnr family transcriptional regulator n=1 Tax=Desertivirga brevis TaxID=2810310 RepID=UPI001A959714|nr:Crp/Fnr family transcriptional regulator [Pedobacter sp. SYSU D00873]